MEILSPIESVGTLAQVPWAEGRIVSWCDVKEFNADKFFVIGRLIERIREHFRQKPREQALGEQDRSGAEQDMRMVEIECKGVGLIHSAGAVFDFRNDLLAIRHKVMTSGDIDARLDEVARAIHREMRLHCFFFLPPDRAKYYLEPMDFGEQVKANFSTALSDIEEASKSYACGRWTACVFPYARDGSGLAHPCYFAEG
jgi:hypothetical protein